MRKKTIKRRLKRAPNKIRTIMEKELKKQESNLLKKYGYVFLNHEYKNPQNDMGMVEVKTMDDEWLKPDGGTWRNPSTGKTESIHIDKFITFERGIVKIDGQNVESIRQVELRPEKVKEYFNAAFQECSNDKSLSNLIENVNWWGDVSPSAFWAGSGTFNSGKILPFPPGPFTRQMYIYDQWKMLSRAASLVDYNPLAKAGVAIKTAFVVGTGPKIQTQDKKLQDAVDKFWETNDFTNRLKMYDKMLSTNGEFFGELTDSDDGLSYRHRSIDPGTIYDIITEPRDIEKVYGYQLIYNTQYQMYTKGASGKQVPLSQFVYETMPPDNVVHIKINVQENEKRGRSDLLPVLNICQFFEDYLRFTVLKTIVQNSFAWDITLKNADESDITTFQTNENATTPVPMQTFVHNDNVVREPMQYQGSGGRGSSSTFQEIISAFGIGFLLPTAYLDTGSGGNRASAITATEPAAKGFLDRRGVWESYLRKIVAFIAKKEGISVEVQDIEITWPEIAPENTSEKIKNILIGIQENFITLTRGAEMYAKELDIRSYDSADEFKAIVKEKTDAIIGRFYQQDLVTMSTDIGGGKAGGSGGASSASGAKSATPQPVVSKGKPIDNPSATPAGQYDGQTNGLKNSTKKDIKAVGKS